MKKMMSFRKSGVYDDDKIQKNNIFFQMSTLKKRKANEDNDQLSSNPQNKSKFCLIELNQ
jgi:hypothetical protein